MAQPLSQLNAFGVALSTVGLLLTSGALGFWFRTGTTVKTTEKIANEAKRKSDANESQIADISTRLNDAEHTAKDAQSRVDRMEPQVHSLVRDLATTTTILDTIVKQMGKLDKVDTMAASVQLLKETVDNVMQNALVPRPELNRQFENDDRRFKRIEDDVRDLHKRVPTDAA